MSFSKHKNFIYVNKLFIFNPVSFRLRYYEGHPISSDIGLIPPNLCIKSEYVCIPNVAMNVAYWCVKYGDNLI